AASRAYHQPHLVERGAYYGGVPRPSTPNERFLLGADSCVSRALRLLLDPIAGTTFSGSYRKKCEHANKNCPGTPSSSRKRSCRRAVRRIRSPARIDLLKSFARLIGTLLVPNQTRSAQTRVSLRDRGSGAGRALVTRRRAALRQARLSFSLRQDLAIPFGRDALQAVHDRTGPGRDQAADDDVLLQADQIVGLAVHGRLREDAGRLLEGGRGDEGAGVQAGLGDALEHRLCRRRAAILGHHLG